MENIVAITGILLMALAAARAALGTLRLAAQRARNSVQQRRSLVSLKAKFTDRQALSIRNQHVAVPEARPFFVAGRRDETPNGRVASFYLVPADSGPVPEFRPGQFLTVEVRLPGHAQPLRRCYSISSSPNEQRCYRITVKRIAPPAGAPSQVPAGFLSNLMHDRLRVGSMVQILPPAGAFCLDPASTRPLVLIAGGIGITPFLSMLTSLAEQNSARPIFLFYGVRNRLEHAMHDELKALQRAFANIHVTTYYSAPTPSCRMGVDFDVAGHVTAEGVLRAIGDQNADFYVCGPRPMMDTLPFELKTAGVSEMDIKTETFVSLAPISSSTEGVATESKKANAVQVRFARSKSVSKWTNSTASILELAEANGIKAPYGCRAGACGTCKAKLLAGTVTYVREPAVQPEAGSCLLCVTRPSSDITLEL